MDVTFKKIVKSRTAPPGNADVLVGSLGSKSRRGRRRSQGGSELIYIGKSRHEIFGNGESNDAKEIWQSQLQIAALFD